MCTRLSLFTRISTGQLEYLDWNNVVVAGGCVLACLEQRPPLPPCGDIDMDFYDQCHAHPDSDIDMFLFGLSPQEATAKVLQIHEDLRKPIKHLDSLTHDLVIRTTNTLAFVHTLIL